MKASLAFTACLLAVGAMATGAAGATETSNGGGVPIRLVAGGHGSGGHSFGGGGHGFGGIGGLSHDFARGDLGGGIARSFSGNSFRGGNAWNGGNWGRGEREGREGWGRNWYGPWWGLGWGGWSYPYDYGYSYPYYGYYDYSYPYYGYDYGSPYYGGYSTAYGSDLGTSASNVPPATAPVLIVNPPNTGATLSFVVDGRTYTLQPGFQQQLSVVQGTTVRFDRGSGHGEAAYSLSPGVYTFGSSREGWELFKQPMRSGSPQQASPTLAPAPAR